MTKKYNPYKIGRRLYKDGYGISDIWGAVKHDSDMAECYRGYCEAQWKDKRKELWTKLGYSRVGLGNV